MCDIYRVLVDPRLCARPPENLLDMFSALLMRRLKIV